MSSETTSTGFFENPHVLTAIGLGLAVGLSALGSAIATAHAAIFVLRAPSVRILSFVPIVTAGILAIYGLIMGVILTSDSNHKNHAGQEHSIEDAAKDLAAGAAVGLSCLASGIGMAMFLKRINDGSAFAASPKPVSGANAPENEELLISPSIGNTSTEEVGAYSRESYRKIIFTNIFLELIGFYGLVVALLLVQ